MTSEIIAAGCPDPQMLSAYIDGKLDPTERGQIEDHISRCEDCYFVVKETALVQAALDEESGRKGNVHTSEVTSRARFVPLLLPIAATLILTAGAIALWRNSQPSPLDPRAALVAAVGERRFFDPRLTGGFKFGERVGPTRGRDPWAAGAVSGDWEVLAAAAKVRQDFVAPMDSRAMATLAASHLFLGEADQGIQLLQQTLMVPAVSERDRARLLSDLSGALLIRGVQRSDAADLESALVNAEAALRASDAPQEALHNRALALELLDRPEAAAAWEACAAKETDPRWREEALRRRGRLSVR